MNKKHLTEAEQQELLLRIKKNYTYDAKSGRLTSSRYGRAIRGGKRDKRGYLYVNCKIDKRSIHVARHRNRLRHRRICSKQQISARYRNKLVIQKEQPLWLLFLLVAKVLLKGVWGDSPSGQGKPCTAFASYLCLGFSRPDRKDR